MSAFMPQKKLPYAEGDWIAVPLLDRGFAIGLVARMDREGGIIGYFFGPKFESFPLLEMARGKFKRDAILVLHFGDLGLLEGKWKVLGRLVPWHREDWPVPVFVRTDVVTGVHQKVIYSEDNLLTEVQLLPCSAKEAADLATDGTSGAGAVELKLTRLLSQFSTSV